jgi:hypothetical protein
MNKLLLIWIIIFFCALPLFAQSVDTAWVRRYNGPANLWDCADAIAVDSDGNVYVTGKSFRSEQIFDYVTVKYDSSGNEVWVRSDSAQMLFVEGSNPGPSNSIVVDKAGNIYVTRHDYVTIKYDASGNSLWTRRYSGPENASDEAAAIAVDDNGNVYVTGESYGGGPCYAYDFLTVKYDASGNELWVNRYSGPSGADDIAGSIALDRFGNIYIAGMSSGGVKSYEDYAVIKYYPNGDTAWTRRYNGPGNVDDAANALAVDRDGNVYVTGTSWGNDTSYDYTTIKYYTNGDIAWLKRYNGPENSHDVAYGIGLDRFNNVYITGNSGKENTTIKYDSSGNEIWVRRSHGLLGYIDFYRTHNMTVDSDGNVFITGWSFVDSLNWDYATVKYDKDGNSFQMLRYDGPSSSWDQAYAITIDSYGNIYVTGGSEGNGTSSDYATIKYVQKSDGETKNWKTYQGKKLGFEIKYPADLLTISKDGEKVILTHSIPFEHSNPCYEGGDDSLAVLKDLTDFNVSLRIFNTSFEQTIKANEYPNFSAGYLREDSLKVDHGFIDDVLIGSLKGYCITAGVEGCGIYTYYFSLNSNNTLQVQRSFIPELNPIIRNSKEYLKLPGIISPDEEERLFNLILSSFKFLK